MRMYQFFKDRSAATAVTFAFAAIPVVLSVGTAFDYTREYRASFHAQAVLDAAVLSAAASNEVEEAKLKVLTQHFIDSNISSDAVLEASLDSFKYDAEKDVISATLSGMLDTSFLTLAGIKSLEIEAQSVAIRGVTGSVEVALVLDNTWSMSETDGTGTRKIDALKKAAKDLVQQLKKNDKADVKVALVPYGDYVNVGTDNRSQPWISVGADYTTEKICTDKTSTQTETCTTVNGPASTCTKYTDGVPSTYTCYPQKKTTCTPLDPPKTTTSKSCSGGTSYKWYGCVASRKTGTLRLDDSSPSTPYPGLLTTSQRCLNPIVPLTNKHGPVISAIETMIINVGTSYYPLTYIPAGLVWGLNVLSPTAPFTEGAAYDAKNERPRKVLVLMTDGENTLRFNSSNGQHTGLDNDATKAAAQVKATNDDTLAICDKAKAQKIEIFTIALAVDDANAKAMLESCASGADHYFDASNNAALQIAFAMIVKSLRDIRLES
ncbi:pilus assembly protein TadG-related protein [Chthonobacter albigriseus]|uniref:pilus assembly protein TadG-related protein n=1 Tax=Chthonobacter albigriseus TaxID=1683161 RepID=UPI0015EE5EA9|nr:pilus assembly protein TadG-related protein [Chthonobacter albigriseus]